MSAPVHKHRKNWDFSGARKRSETGFIDRHRPRDATVGDKNTCVVMSAATSAGFARIDAKVAM